jgi:hypothetical protein
MAPRYNGTSARMLGQEETQPDETGETPAESADATTAADYSFEGYSIEFNDKVGMMPITSTMPPKH